MPSIVDKLKTKEHFYALSGASEEAVQAAEQLLGVSFSKEYREYLLAFGLASFQGHELTGITDSKRLSVVDVTKEERWLSQGIPTDWYVLEQANIDGIVIWQAADGTVYKVKPGCAPSELCSSLSEYIDM